MTTHGLTASFSPSWHFQPFHGMDLWRSLGGGGGADYSYQNHKDLVIRPFQERGTDWGLLGGLFGFSSQRGLFMTQSQTLWSHTRCTCTRNIGLEKKWMVNSWCSTSNYTADIYIHVFTVVMVKISRRLRFTEQKIILKGLDHFQIKMSWSFTHSRVIQDV